MAERSIADESKAIAFETRRDSTSMKTIASLTMVYLPSTFAASVFSTGFFTFTPGDAEGVKVDTKIWILVVIAFLMSVLTIGTWVYLNKHGVPKQLNWARQRQPEDASPLELAQVAQGQGEPAAPLPNRSRAMQVVSNPRINLPAGPGDDIA